MKILALILALVCPSFAQQQAVIGSYRDFSGGLNNDDASVSLAANESPNLLNVNIDDPKGALTQRRGYQTCGTIPSGGIATNLYEYAKNDGTRRLIVTDNTTVWQTANCIEFSTVATGLNAQEMPRFATILDNLWVVNGSTYPIVWDGVTATQLDGGDGRPTAPITKYISYWKSRVWLANAPTSPSSVFFSALVDDLGNILNPATSTGAWVSLNQIYINRDDGSQIYGMTPYRDNLYVWKETGINRIIFESEFDLALEKNVSKTGSKFNESIVEMDDGLLRFLSDDGIYAFDGVRVQRLSSHITPTIESIKQQTGGQGFLLWDTYADFDLKGVGDDNIDLALVNGAVAISSIVPVNPNLSANYKSTEGWTASGFTYNTVPSTAGYTDLAYPGIGVRDWVYYECRFSAPSSESNFLFELLSTTGTLYSTDAAMSLATTGFNVGSATGVYAKVTARDGECSGGYLSTPVMASSHSTVFPAWFVSNRFSMSGALTGQSVFMSFFPSRPYAAEYISEVSTFTGLTQWRTLGAEMTLSGQTINLYARTGVTADAVLANQWEPILPGSIISTTTDQYAQWKAGFLTTDSSVTPLLNSLSMGYATGDTAATAVKGIQYKSRLWLAASTSPANNFNDMVIVESRSPLNSYTLYDLPLSAMAIWSGNLYGAIGNTGKIARLDYGETDDGAAIRSFWDSRDEIFDNPIFYKTVNQVILDYSNSPANTGISVSLSPDMGNTWQSRSINLGASTLPRNTIKLNYDANTALGFRTQVTNNTLGLGFKLYGIHPLGSMIPFKGN